MGNNVRTEFAAIKRMAWTHEQAKVVPQHDATAPPAGPPAHRGFSRNVRQALITQMT
jgi:hypothetical protein